MGIVLDYTSRISPVALRAAGVVGVCRYLSPIIEKTKWKRITQSEYDELERNGIPVTLNWEYDARDWLGGANVGKSHGEQAVAQARALGYPAGRVIVGSADFDMTRSQWNNGGAQYARAFAKAVRDGGYRPGVYGPWDVLQWVHDEGIMDAFWQAGMSTAWSGGRNRNPWPGAHIRQRGHKTVGGADTDWNEILVEPLWGAAAPPVNQVEEDMQLFRVPAGGIFLATPAGPRPVTWHEYHDLWGDPKFYQLDSEARLAELVPVVSAELTDAQVKELARELAAETDVTSVEQALRNVLLKGVAAAETGPTG